VGSTRLVMTSTLFEGDMSRDDGSSARIAPETEVFRWPVPDAPLSPLTLLPQWCLSRPRLNSTVYWRRLNLLCRYRRSFQSSVSVHSNLSVHDGRIHLGHSDPILMLALGGHNRTLTNQLSAIPEILETVKSEQLASETSSVSTLKQTVALGTCVNGSHL
jgi:hypothetical protein